LDEVSVCRPGQPGVFASCSWFSRMTNEQTGINWVAIIILNWNGWQDTIECLDSVLRLRGCKFRIVVCDNGSTNDSIEKISEWADGKILTPRHGPAWLRVPHLDPVCPVDRVIMKPSAQSKPDLDAAPITILEVGANLGFAGGMNAGLRHVLANETFSHFWLLNNDTIVDPDSLLELLNHMGEDPRIGICGSRLMWYDQPERLQAAGGCRFNWDWAVGSPITMPYLAADQSGPCISQEVESQIDYICGASMLVSRAYLTQVGLMSEEYFLYFEEMDWAIRNAGRFRQGFAPASVVYHKEGRSIGSSSTSRPSLTSLSYMTKNRLRFTRRYAPSSRSTVLRRILFEILVYIKRNDWVAARTVAFSLLKLK